MKELSHIILNGERLNFPPQDQEQEKNGCSLHFYSMGYRGSRQGTTQERKQKSPRLEKSSIPAHYHVCDKKQTKETQRVADAGEVVCVS